MSSRLRIALVAHPRHPIAEPFKGGMEAHSFHLARGLMERGHDVTLFAAGDSDTRFEIDPLMPVHYDRDYPWENFRADPVLYTVLDKAFGSARHRIFSGRYDVVHNNALHRFVLQSAREKAHPCVTSLHVPPFDALHHFVRESLCPTHCITVTSLRQTLSWWPEGPPQESAVLYNGIDPALWPFAERGGTHGLWCGRITPNKGTHLAVQAAIKAGIPLRMFGYLEQEAYFSEEIAPFLSDRITYGGVVPGAALAKEMREAGVLLFTPCWDEPFGLVAVEAMASGTPVAAFDRGATREIVGDDAGRFAPPGDVDALAKAMQQALLIDRLVPRKRVEACFTHDRMIDSCEALYDRVRHAARAARA
ncbi:glycosyltransferase [Swaminathania salitolerans]|uniref:Glycosyl transferase family 1 n=1 Tax=Swaminathania salitolerans TaxID=182838 RepID=A0A511BL87_9PROT|nr:glycosyltransferase [Swaminathania salitolerans]GBQ09951.1 glycosyltransferase [Swaminathania salitolerans LMG 21291]GEL01110.1 glycosyl transferase family 1 [Swaminathania salitolerans]